MVTVAAFLALLSISTTEGFKAAFLAIDTSSFVVLAAIIFINQLISAARLIFLIRGLELNLSFSEAFGTVLVSQFTTLLPAGAVSSELAKVVMLKSGKSFFFIAYDKVISILVATLCGLLGLVLATRLAQVEFLAFGLVPLASAILLGLFVARLPWQWLRTDALGGGSPRLRFCLSLFLFATVQQILSGLGGYVVCGAFGVHNVPFLDMIYINALASVAYALPLSIGGFGIREGAFSALLSLYGVPIETSISLCLSASLFPVLVSSITATILIPSVRKKLVYLSTGAMVRARIAGQWIVERIRGLDTVRWASAEQLGLAAERSYHYSSSSSAELDVVLKELKISQADCVLDIGCGKGAVLLHFRRFPFKKVDGIELSEKLCEIARKNIARLRYVNMTVYQADAALFTDLDSYNFYYMYNPFPAEVLKSVIKNIVDSYTRLPRDICLLYNNPKHAEVIDSSGKFELAKVFPSHQGLILNLYRIRV